MTIGVIIACLVVGALLARWTLRSLMSERRSVRNYEHAMEVLGELSSHVAEVAGGEQGRANKGSRAGKGSDSARAKSRAGADARPAVASRVSVPGRMRVAKAQIPEKAPPSVAPSSPARGAPPALPPPATSPRSRCLQRHLRRPLRPRLQARPSLRPGHRARRARPKKPVRVAGLRPTRQKNPWSSSPRSCSTRPTSRPLPA